MIPTPHTGWQLIQVSRSSVSEQTSNMQMDRALLLFTELQDLFSKDTLCRAELLQGRDGKIPNLHPNVFKTLKVLRWNSLAQADL